MRVRMEQRKSQACPTFMMWGSSARTHGESLFHIHDVEDTCAYARASHAPSPPPQRLSLLLPLIVPCTGPRCGSSLEKRWQSQRRVNTSHARQPSGGRRAPGACGRLSRSAITLATFGHRSQIMGQRRGPCRQERELSGTTSGPRPVAVFPEASRGQPRSCSSLRFRLSGPTLLLPLPEGRPDSKAFPCLLTAPPTVRKALTPQGEVSEGCSPMPGLPDKAPCTPDA